jgi:hypothetical protein
VFALLGKKDVNILHVCRSVCVPVCMQGCVHGSCVEPDICRCDFSYVGANCSIHCQCNNHADCAGPDKLDQCLECHHHTKVRFPLLLPFILFIFD